MQRKILLGIPARMGASRLPGKPLKKILDHTVIEHVVHRSRMSRLQTGIFVATCDEEIKQVVEAIDCQVVMTDPEINRPGLRVAEAAKTLGLSDDDIVVIVQGDEPLIFPEMIDAAIEAFLKNPEDLCVCLMAPCSEKEWMDPNEIKVVTDLKGYAKYMSRSPIPSNTRGIPGPRFKQVCVFPFTYGSLNKFLNVAETPCEEAESIELIRAIEHDLKVKMVETQLVTKSVDTEADRQEIEELMKSDKLYSKYRGIVSTWN